MAILVVPNSSFTLLFVTLVCLLCAVLDVTSSSISSKTSVAPLAPRSSATATSMTESSGVSPTSVALSHLAANCKSGQLPVAGESSIRETSVLTLSQLPPGTGGGPRPRSSSGAIIGVVVAVVVTLVVVSVIVAAVLIAWRVHWRERKTLGKHCD